MESDFIHLFLRMGSDWNTFLDYPTLLQYENVTQWEWWVFLKNLEDLPLNNMNLYLAQHALTMLALCYLPGCLAGYIQLFRGTKYSRFPKFLDRWLKMRKQLGLLMLLSASLHVILLFFFILKFTFLSFLSKQKSNFLSFSNSGLHVSWYVGTFYRLGW